MVNSTWKGVLTLVNTPKNKRIRLSRQLVEDLELEDEVCIDVFEDMVEIYKPYDENLYAIPLHKESPKDEKSRVVVYCADLIEQINQCLGIEYNGKTSYTIRKIEYRYGCVLVLRIRKGEN